MSTRVIPKEQLTAYQRWELVGLEDAGGDVRSGDVHNQASQEVQAINLPTAEEMERIQQQAAQEGFNHGHEEGYKAGYESGRKAAEADAKRLAELVESMDLELLRQDETLSKELLDLALAVAKQMIHTTIKIKEGIVLEVLRDALESLPGLTGHLRVMVHPADLQLISDFLVTDHGHFSAKAVADNRMERGSFRIESSQSEVEGDLQTRWQEIVDCLGTDTTWLD